LFGLVGFANAGSNVPGLDPADGWIQVNEGYWERLTTDGKLQTVAIGSAGLEQVLGNLNAEMVMLVEEYLAHPDEEMLEVLDGHLKHIASVEANLLTTKEAAGSIPGAIPIPLDWCEYEWEADAGGFAVCTNYADAYSAYRGSSADDCMGLCDLYAYGYVRRTLCNNSDITQTHSCFRNDVINQECDVYASLYSVAARSCWAYATAYVNCPDYSYYRSETDTSTSCGICKAACIEIAEEEEAID
jgi:hypothetical protein